MAYIDPDRSRRRMAVGPGGDVILAAWLGSDSGVTKWRPDGGIDWQQSLAGFGSRRLVTMLRDDQGDVLVSGERQGRWWVLRLQGSDGAVQWQHSSVDGPLGRVNDMVLMPNGDLIAIGFAAYAGSERRRLVRYEASTGAVLWEQLAPLGQFAKTDLDRLAVSASGELWMFTTVGVHQDSISLARVDPSSGEPLASRVMAPESGTRLLLNGMLSDSSGPIAIQFGVFDFAANSTVASHLVGLAGDLSERWIAELPGQPSLLSANAQGEIAVAIPSRTDPGFLIEPLLLKLDGDGDLVWSATPFPATERSFWPRDLLIDETGDVYLTGDEDPDGLEGNSIFTARLNGADGQLLWNNDWRGTGVPGHIGTLTGQAGFLARWQDELISTGVLQNLTRDLAFRRLQLSDGALIGSGGDSPIAGMSEQLIDYIGNRMHVRTPEGGYFLVADLPDSVLTGYTLLHLDEHGELIWRVERVQPRYGGHGTAHQVATDHAGNAIVLAWYTDPHGNIRSLVESFAATDGAHRWTRDWARRPGGIAVDPANAIILGSELSSAAWSVEKLDESGQTLWTATSPATGQADKMQGVAVDAAGDVIVSGSRLGPGLLHRIATIKLAGHDGTELWNQLVQGAEDTLSTDLAVDAQANVLVAGIDKPRQGQVGTPIFARLASSTGAIEWLTSLPSSAARMTVRLAPEGKLTAASTAGFVVRLHADTGAVDWLSTGGTSGGSVSDMAMDEEGNVLIVSSSAPHSLYKYNGVDGRFLWSRRPQIEGISEFITHAIGLVQDHQLLIFAQASIPALGRDRIALAWFSNALNADGFEGILPLGIP